MPNALLGFDAGGIVNGGLSIALAGLAVLTNVCEVSPSSLLCTGCSLKTSNLT